MNLNGSTDRAINTLMQMNTDMLNSTNFLIYVTK